MPSIRSTAFTGAVLVGAALACAPGAAQAQRSRCRAREVSLSPPEGRVSVNSTTPILATTYDAAGNPCDNVTYTWSSSNSSVATVDRGGIVHGMSVGTATITARTGVGAAARIGRASVTVEEGEVTVQSTSTDSVPGFHPRAHAAGQGMAAIDRQPDGVGQADNIQVDPLQLVLIRGERRALDFHALKADGSAAAPVPIVFQVSPGSERIASVDTFGFVSALLEAGTATVTLTVPGQSRIQSRVVRVEVRNDTVQFNRRELAMAPGMTETLSVYVPAQGRAMAPQLFQYSSSDPSRLQVNAGNPILTAVAPGNVRVTATNAYLPEFSAMVHIHRRVRTMSLTPEGRPMPADSTVIIPIGGQVTLRAQALSAEDNTNVPEAPVTWRIVDGAWVSLDTAHGVVRGLRSGLSTFFVSTMTSRDSQATASIRVKVVAGGLATPRARIGLGVGERTTVDVVLLDERGTSAGPANSYLTWNTDSIARIENQNQLVSLRPGHARLTGRTGWDSTVTLDVFVVNDLMVLGHHQGRQGLMGLSADGQFSWFVPDSLLEFVAWSPDLTRVAGTTQVNPAARVPAAFMSIVNSDGSGARRVTDDSSYAKYPSFVPGLTGNNGAIVFEWNRGGRAQIWKVDLHGDTAGVPTVITTTPAANTAPAVSPDGQRIAYVSVRETSPGRSTYGIYQSSIDGSGERPVIVLPQGFAVSGAPSYTRDGRSILFVRREPQRLPTARVCRISVTAQPGDTVVAVTPLDRVVASFAQSGDGQTLVLNTLTPLPNSRFDRHLVLFPMNGGPPVQVDPPDMQPANPVYRPATPAAPATPH